MWNKINVDRFATRTLGLGMLYEDCMQDTSVKAWRQLFILAE